MIEFPISVSIFKTSVQLHTLTEYLGIFCGFRYFLFLRKQKGDAIVNENRILIVIAALFGAVIGSRLVGCLENIESFLLIENKLNFILQNKSIVGGLIGGLFGVEIMKLCLGERKRSGDLFVFPLLIAMVIGRVGCFSMGVYENTFGIETHFIFGMDLGDGLLRHPVMLYEIAFLMLLWIMLKFINKKKKLADGQLFKLFLISYLIFRFVVEFFKPNVIYLMGLGAIQLSALIGLIYYLVLYFLKKMHYLEPTKFTECGSIKTTTPKTN